MLVLTLRKCKLAANSNIDIEWEDQQQNQQSLKTDII